MNIKVFKGLVKSPELGIDELRIWLEEPDRSHEENFKFHFGLDVIEDIDGISIPISITNIEEVSADFDTMLDLWIKDQLPVWVDDALKHKYSFITNPRGVITRTVEDCCKCYFRIPCSFLSDDNYKKIEQACYSFIEDYLLKKQGDIFN